MGEENHEFSVQVNATKNQIETLKESVIWNDILRELDFWISGFDKERDSLIDRISSENLTTAATLTLAGSIDGRKKAAEYFKQMPDMFLDILEAKKDDT